MEELCSERHKSIEEKFLRHERWLGEHEEKIDVLNRSDAVNTQSIKELCGKIADLVSTIKWLIGLGISFLSIFASALIGFFFYAVQKGLLK